MSARRCLASALLICLTSLSVTPADQQTPAARIAVPQPSVLGSERGTANPPEVLTIQSAVLGEQRRVYVQLPHDYERSKASYPVLVVLDGEWLFELTRSHVRFFSEYEAMQSNLPQMIVVGLENVDRDRDYVPTKNSGKEYVFDTAGHADRFLDFLDQELLVLLDRRYRTASSRALVGWSFGGLFTSYALITRPQLFDAYLCISPAVWWDEDLVEKLLPKLAPERSKRLVLTLGSGEEGGWVFESSMKLLAALEAAPKPLLSVETVELPDVGHSWGVPGAIDKGLQRLFDGYLPPDDVRSAGLEAIDTYYEKLSARWHYKVQAPYSVLQGLALSQWKPESMEPVASLLREAARRYPVEPGAHYFLGKALAKLGEHQAALAELEKALELETTRAQPRQLKLPQYRKAVAKQRKQLGVQ